MRNYINKYSLYANTLQNKKTVAIMRSPYPQPSTVTASIDSAAAPSPPLDNSLRKDLNLELDSFYSDIASIENVATAAAAAARISPTPNSGEPLDGMASSVASPGAASAEEAMPPSDEGTAASVSLATGRPAERVVKRAKKVKTTLSNIKDMSHLISKWQKAQQDL